MCPSVSSALGSSTALSRLVCITAVAALIIVLPYPTPESPVHNSEGRVKGAPPPGLPNVQARYERLLQQGTSADQLRTAYGDLFSALTSDRWAREGNSTHAEPLAVFLHLVRSQFDIGEAVLPCRWDPTLPTSFSSTKYLVASDLYNSEHLMPNFVAQVVQLALLLPRGSLHVSVYESSSEDSTPQWLRLLELLLRSMGAPCDIIVGGEVRRTGGQDRIAYLASVRNAALAPVLDRLGRGEKQQQQQQQQKRGKEGGAEVNGHKGSADIIDSSSSSSSSSGGGAGGGGAFVPDYVVFLNDVYFCAGDVVRLMQHRADIMCGLDTSHTLGHVAWSGALLDLPLEFYDFWVARTVDGARFTRYPPYTSHAPSRARLRRGLPFKVYCCWNGLVVLRAAPLLAGLRFRNRTHADECDASECSLLCDDYQRLGYTDVGVDPGVRVAYYMPLARRVALGKSDQSVVLPWVEVGREAARPGGGWRRASGRAGEAGGEGGASSSHAGDMEQRSIAADAGISGSQSSSDGAVGGGKHSQAVLVECCPKSGSAYVHFNECHLRDHSQEANFTDMWLATATALG